MSPGGPLQAIGKLFQLFQHAGADFVGRLTMERQFDDAILQLPGERISLKVTYSVRTQIASPPPYVEWRPDSNDYGACLAVYKFSISSRNCVAIRSRFSLPFAVRRPFSTLKGSERIWKARTCL